MTTQSTRRACVEPPTCPLWAPAAAWTPGAGSSGSGSASRTRPSSIGARREFALHELAAEDGIKTHQRPKLEVYGDSLSTILKGRFTSELAGAVGFSEIQLFIGAGFLMTVRGRAALR